MSARSSRASVRLAAGAMLVIAPAVVWAQAQSTASVETVTADLASRQGTSLGPPGGEIRSLVVAPSDPERLYLGTTGHVFVSVDRGRRWRELPLRLSHEAVVDNLLVHPEDADRVYAAYWLPKGSGGLARSDDGGHSWRQLDLGGRPSLRAIAAAPSRAETIYVGGIGGVWRSDDGGESWRNANGRGLATEFIESLAVDPRDPEHVYAGTWRQVYRSRNGGETWSRIYEGMAVDRDVFSLAISPHDPETILAGTCNFLYCSTNAGASWGERRAGLAKTHNRVHTIVHHPQREDVLFAGTRGALYRSEDAGHNWSVVLGDVTVTALAIDGEGDTLFVGTEERGVLIGHPAKGFAESNLGLTSARIAAFDMQPDSPRVLFAARSDGPLHTSLHYSTDMGHAWKPLAPGAPIGVILALRAQASPVNRLIVAGTRGWYSIHPGGRWGSIPAPPGRLIDLEIAHDADGSVVALTGEGLYVAAAESLVDDAGEALPFEGGTDSTWRPLWLGQGPVSLAIAGDRILALGADRALAGNIVDLRQGGQLRQTVPRGMSGATRDLVLDPDAPGVAYAITAREVYRTTDGGQQWSRLPLPWRAADLRAIAVDPSEPGRVLALDYRGAVYRGHGDGQHWLVLDDDPGLHRAWALRSSSHTPGFALVATQGHGLRAVDLNPLTPPVPAAPAGGEGSAHDS